MLHFESDVVSELARHKVKDRGRQILAIFITKAEVTICAMLHCLSGEKYIL